MPSLCLFLVSIVYAPYQVQIKLYQVWAADSEAAEDLAMAHYAEDSEPDWEEYEIDVTEIDTTPPAQVESFDQELGWIGSGTCPVSTVFSWSRG